MEYVCGFMFDNALNKVVLIHKNKPEWQKGKVNGVGGKMEVVRYANTTDERPILEEPDVAMAREFREETGYNTEPHEWTLFRSERFQNGVIVHFLMATGRLREDLIQSMTDERVVVYDVDFVLGGWRVNLMYNLPYLIEMAIALHNAPPGMRPLP